MTAIGSTCIFHGKLYNSIFPGIVNISDFKGADRDFSEITLVCRVISEKTLQTRVFSEISLSAPLVGSFEVGSFHLFARICCVIEKYMLLHRSHFGKKKPDPFVCP